MEPVVVYGDQTALQELGGGVSRKVLAYNDDMMVVEVHFEEGGVGAPHSHPHCQSTYVISGKFRFTIDGRDYEVSEGDTIVTPGNMTHGTLCLKKGVLADIFTPMRKDFL